MLLSACWGLLSTTEEGKTQGGVIRIAVVRFSIADVYILSALLSGRTYRTRRVWTWNTSKQPNTTNKANTGSTQQGTQTKRLRCDFYPEFNIIKGHLNFAPPRTSLLSFDISYWFICGYFLTFTFHVLIDCLWSQRWPSFILIRNLGIF